MAFKPMLAYTVKYLDRVKYPVWVSPKLDGIRAIVKDGIVYSRSMKQIRSEAVQQLFGRGEYNNFDGELIYGDPTDKSVFNSTTSFCMSKEVPEGMSNECISFFVFDYICDAEYIARRQILLDKICLKEYPQVEIVPIIPCFEKESVVHLEEMFLEQGYEGIMLNSIDGKYKQGRSTEKEGILGKLKRFLDSEAIIMGFEELQHNTNEQKTNELGNSERSTSKDGMVGGNTLGNLLVKDYHSGVEFSIGSGFDLETRQNIWDNRDNWLGKIVKYKYFAIQSAYEKPRFPVFLGVRDIIDI